MTTTTSAPSTPPEPAASSGGVDQPIGTFHAFRYANYRLYWIGNLFTAAAQWTQEITISWVVYVLTGSPGDNFPQNDVWYRAI